VRIAERSKCRVVVHHQPRYPGKADLHPGQGRLLPRPPWARESILGEGKSGRRCSKRKNPDVLRRGQRPKPLCRQGGQDRARGRLFPDMISTDLTARTAYGSRPFPT
jgi:hypothetical protein